MSKLLLLAITITMGFANVLHAQKAEWVYPVGNTSGNTEVLSASRYRYSDVLIGGRYDCKDMLLGPTSLKNSGQSDGFAAIMNQYGNVLWAMGFGGAGEDAVTAAASDDAGNMYIAISYSSLSLTVGGFTMPNQGESDAALVKITSSFSVVAVWHIGNAGHDEITDIIVDNSGNIIVGGQTNESQGPGPTSMFVRKFDRTWTTLWERKSIGTETTTLSSVAVDSIGNCYIAGSLWGTLEVDGGPTLDAGQVRQGFILQYSPSGEAVKAITDTTYTRINSIAAHGQHLYAAGEFINYYMGWGWPLADSKILLNKYDINLRTIWERSCGGAVGQQSLDIVRSIDTDEEGGVYLTGYFFSGRLDFAGDTLGNYWNVNYFYQQGFVLKYDSSGNEIWSKGIGGRLNDIGSEIAVMGKNRLYLTGGYESDEVRIDGHMLTNTGATREIYVHLKPPRIGRNVLSFVTFLENATASVSPLRPVAGVDVYPNPANDRVHISMPDIAGRPADLRLYTLDGRLLRAISIPHADATYTIDVSSLRPGMYFLRIASGNNLTVKSFVR